MSYPQRLRLARQRGLALPYARTLARLRSPQAIQDVMTGRIAMMFVDFAIGSPQAKS